MTQQIRQDGGSDSQQCWDFSRRRQKWLGYLVSGPLFFRRPVKKEGLLQVFVLYLCLCHLTPVSTCGDNPLRRFRNLSRMLGKDVNSLLNVLRETNPSLYRQVQVEWRRYADCVGRVDTGYFKRSSLPLAQAPLTEEERGAPGGQLVRPRVSSGSVAGRKMMKVLQSAAVAMGVKGAGADGSFV